MTLPGTGTAPLPELPLADYDNGRPRPDGVQMTITAGPDCEGACVRSRRWAATAICAVTQRGAVERVHTWWISLN